MRGVWSPSLLPCSLSLPRFVLLSLSLSWPDPDVLPLLAPGDEFREMLSKFTKIPEENLRAAAEQAKPKVAVAAFTDIAA